MHCKVAEVHLRLQVVNRPSGQVSGLIVVARVGSNSCVSTINGTPCHVLHGTDEASSATHDEASVPVLRQEQFETNAGADNPVDLEIGLGILGIRSYRLDRLKNHVRQPQLPNGIDTKLIGRLAE